ncbi:hypothetical protein BJ973_005027 [Actinoplanes tereljensis]|uniref:Uncharacterized protein n=1 Tax=Paractinoplanes tereljensis TaxID=571912 RepID=A0A919TSM2_9ACTN|nr:hypothetical protein [Actinoplanes tereljensis]GIF21528.1 hypothetical protein Ate02nite_42580 [Actinoplanes tereljensis]
MRARLPWILAGVAIVVVLAVIGVLLRPDARENVDVSAIDLPIGATTLPASRGLGAAPTPSTEASRTSAAPITRTTTTTTPRPTRTTAAPAVRTRIVEPANNSKVPWPFDAKFTVSPADATAVISLAICVADRCYLDGKLDIIDGQAAPYTVYLGSTKPEGTGVPWQLRLDRLAKADFDALVKTRDAAIAAGTWGVTASTPIGALNDTPVSTLTVTKQP